MIWLKLRRTCCDGVQLVGVNLSWGKKPSDTKQIHVGAYFLGW